MGLEKVELHNRGMSQDLSISKDSNEFAYKNMNIRIQSTNDGTLLSVTNVKGPRPLTPDVGIMGYWYVDSDNYVHYVADDDRAIRGDIVGKCLAGDYLVLFTLYNDGTDNIEYIYRVDLRTLNYTSTAPSDGYEAIILYKGTNGALHFSKTQPIDTLFYYESSTIQKVYWTNGWLDNPRVINIVKQEGRTYNGQGIHNIYNGHTYYSRFSSDNDFAFYPKITNFPAIAVKKSRSALSELPVGVIQYFVSYFNTNGAETLVANATSLLSIDLDNRGAPADTTTTNCAFEVTLSNLDTSFDYARVYSAIRTSAEGPINAYIVKDIKIDKSGNSATEYTFIDNGTNNETIQDSQLLFIGGQPFFANTLTQKDNTVFFGGLKTENKLISNTLKTLINTELTSTALSFTHGYIDLSFDKYRANRADVPIASGEPEPFDPGDYPQQEL